MSADGQEPQHRESPGAASLSLAYRAPEPYRRRRRSTGAPVAGKGAGGPHLRPLGQVVPAEAPAPQQATGPGEPVRRDRLTSLEAVETKVDVLQYLEQHGQVKANEREAVLDLLAGYPWEKAMQRHDVSASGQQRLRHALRWLLRWLNATP